MQLFIFYFFFFSSRRRHTRSTRDWSSDVCSSDLGSMTAFEALNILRHFDLARFGAGSPQAVHLIAEALRHAFLDRFTYLADPDQQPVPIDGLLSDEYVAQVAATIALDRAAPEATAGDPWRFSGAA